MYKAFSPKIKPFESPSTVEQAVAGLWRIDEIILNTTDITALSEKIVNVMLEELGYLKMGYVIIVLSLLDEDKTCLKRVSISRTQQASQALENSPTPFGEIVFNLSDKENLPVKSLEENVAYVTDDLSDMLYPEIGRDLVRDVQKKLGVVSSLVFPINSSSGPLGTIIFSLNKPEGQISEFEKQILTGFTNAAGIAIQHAKLFSSLRAANEKLKELDERKDEFVSLTSHELHTPLAAIRSYLWMAETGRGGPLTEKQKYYLERAYNSTIRLIKLVNDMLNVSRIESGRLLFDKTKLDLVKLLEDTMGEIQPKADELGITIVRDYNSFGPAQVLGDDDKLKEVVINLIGNSLKFTPKGGSIKISLEKKDNEIITHVADTGEGIAPEDLPKLFQKFGFVADSYATNQKASQGTGLGLYISKSIVEAHKGRIWAESAGTGKGATLSFSLPVFSQADLEEFQRANDGKDGLGIIHSSVD